MRPGEVESGERWPLVQKIDSNPRVQISCTSAELDWEGTRTIELLRRPGGPGAGLWWEPRAVA
jgi:hypothetical protein